MAFSLGGLVAISVGAIAIAGCDDPVVPTPAGAFNVQFSQPGGTCNVASHKATLGNVTISGKPEVISDGSNESSVDCTVEKSGSSFSVSARLDSSAIVILDVAGLSESSTLAEPAQGQVSFISPETGGNAYQSPQTSLCNFWVAKDQGQYLAPGEAWFSFSCGSVVSSQFTCAISESYVALKNCAGASPEEEEE